MLSTLSSGSLDAGQGVKPASLLLYYTAVWIHDPGQGDTGWGTWNLTCTPYQAHLIWLFMDRENVPSQSLDSEYLAYQLIPGICHQLSRK